MEEWKDISGYEGIYQVSNLGNVKSLERDVIYNDGKIWHHKEKILKPFDDGQGYLKVNLRKNNKNKYHKIHRLVAEAFIENPENKETVDHINTIKTDNRVENLRWFTYQQQMNNNEITKERNRKAVKENAKKAHEARKKKVINLDTGEVFESVTEASRKYNLSKGNINKCCNGKYKTSAGYHWSYYNEN